MLNTRVTNFKGNTDIQFEDTNLKAGYVSVNWKTSILNALPKESSDTTKISLNPTIIEPGRDPMTGDEMLYNLKTKKGKITKGSTKADDGFYTGSQIRNESEKVFLIQNSTYTTCDLDTAHFHFESTKMKIIQNDMVIAKPIVLYIANIPILGIPFEFSLTKEVNDILVGLCLHMEIIKIEVNISKGLVFTGPQAIIGIQNC